MRVTRAQAEENRQAVINTASRLFREHGFDGIGLKDVMNAAGLTQGGFYKQFESKEDLIAQASQRAMESSAENWTEREAAHPNDTLDKILRFYLSREHRNETAEGCPLPALGSDAARQGGEVRQAFEEGVDRYLAVLEQAVAGESAAERRARAAATLATMVGALLLSRVVKSDTLSREFLRAAANHIRRDNQP